MSTLAPAAARFTKPKLYVSPLPGVTDAAWDRFVRTMSNGAIAARTSSGGFGSFDLRPRRLVELGVMRDLVYSRSGGRRIWTATFIAPNTEESLLRDPIAQYRLFARSMSLYDTALRCGELTDTSGLTRAGKLAVLHRAGRGGLQRWPDGAMSDTTKLVQRVKDLF